MGVGRGAMKDVGEEGVKCYESSEEVFCSLILSRCIISVDNFVSQTVDKSFLCHFWQRMTHFHPFLSILPE